MYPIFRVLLLALALTAMPAHAADPPPLSAYGDLPGVEDMAISPGGTKIAAISRVKQERRLLLLENGVLASSVAVADLKIRGLNWAGEDLLVVAKSDTVDLPLGFSATKTELFSAIIVNSRGGKPATVFADTPSMSEAIFGAYGFRQVSGRWTGYYSGIKYKRSADRTGWEFEHGRPYLFAVDLETNRPSQVARPAAEDHWRDWLVDGQGQVAAVMDMSESGNWTIENAAGVRLAQGSTPSGRAALVSLGETAATVLYSFEDSQAGMTRWFEVPIAGGEAKERFAEVDIEHVISSAVDGTLQGYMRYDGETPKPVFFDAKRQAIINMVYRAFPRLKVTLIDWTPDFTKFIVLTRGNGESGTFYVVDAVKGQADPIGYERPAIHPEQVGPISTVEYTAGDGLALDGVLTLPPGRAPKNLPVILLPHGGPNSHDEATFDWWAQAFASRGYAVFQPNFRGSTNRDMAFRDAGDGQWGRKMQTDISDGLAELVRRGIADPKRACIMGASYGGYAALAGVTLQRGLYRCAVAVAPVSDMGDMLWSNYRESGGSKMLRRNYLRTLGAPSTYNEVSPRRQAAQADAPILLIHGKDDTVVAFDQSSRMADALKAAGKPHELFVMQGEDHWLSKAETRKQMLEQAMRFVQAHNPAD